ncbi:hypothetical protein F0562_015662 [Nyssa sinensis]|uniref:Uncharacterized protein n=1 Tax=Nyssa sinensis TaxID=561372 RepID=A0A5J4ZKT2_9ASTE|nr:hypothetical protein F0562_015662 [Nyssa sinensis]
MQLQGTESPQYLHFSSPIMAPSLYGNMTNQYAAMMVLPQFHSGDDNHQVLSGYEVSPGKCCTVQLVVCPHKFKCGISNFQGSTPDIKTKMNPILNPRAARS